MARTESGSCLAGSLPSLRISLDVLHLLAELLDLGSQFKPLRGEADVIGLGAEGACLARQLLGEEIEPPSDRPPPSISARAAATWVLSRSSSSRMSALAASRIASWWRRFSSRPRDDAIRV